MNNWFLLSMIGSVLLLIGTILTTYGTFKHRMQSSNTSSEINKKTDHIEELTSDTKKYSSKNQELIKLLQDKQNEISKLNDKIYELSNQVVEQSLIITTQLTEGNSFPDIDLLEMKDNNENPITFIRITNKGSNPLFDVSIQYYERENKQDFRIAKLKDLEKYNYEPLGEIRGGGEKILKKIFERHHFENDIPVGFNFLIQTRTNFFNIIFFSRYRNKRFEIAKKIIHSKTVQSKETNVIFENIDKELSEIVKFE